MQQPINLTQQPIKKFALFELGFRPFFLFASLFSIIATGIWMANYVFAWPLPVSSITAIAWHGHEMVFGYAVGITAGFLLTAVRNWTGINTLKGWPLLLLVTSWLLARLLPLTNSAELFVWAAVFDQLFLLALSAALLRPIIKVKQWRQLFIIFKLLLLLAANTLYYLGAFQVVPQGISWGLYSGVYLELALIFTLARRVMPFFIERGIGYQVELKNRAWVDIGSMLALISLWLSDVFFNIDTITALSALALALLHSIRLSGWYSHGIWKKPLLWVLFIAYGHFILGFALQALNYFDLYSPSLPLHAYTYGGIGMMTLGMIARVSLGHTGRSIQQPPSILFWCFLLLFLGAVVRVVIPIINLDYYLYCIAISQLCWISSFGLFLSKYLIIFIKPRVDGQPG